MRAVKREGTVSPLFYRGKSFPYRFIDGLFRTEKGFAKSKPFRASFILPAEMHWPLLFGAHAYPRKHRAICSRVTIVPVSTDTKTSVILIYPSLNIAVRYPRGNSAQDLHRLPKMPNDPLKRWPSTSNIDLRVNVWQMLRESGSFSLREDLAEVMK